MEKINKYGIGSNNKELVVTDKYGNVKSIFQKKITLTTIGSSGPSTLVNNILNIPNYSASLSGYVPTSRQLTINGTTYDLSANRTWNVGTVTSVGVSMPSAFTVANSPITSSGIIAITGAGTTSQYIDGTGALRTFPGLTGYVPYVGATQNVNLGEFGITAGQMTLDVSPTGTATVGTTRWNNTIGSSETTLKGGNVILKNGVDLVARVVNKVTPNTTLTKAGYAAVRVSGAQGQRLAVAYAQANNDNNSADTIGLVTETIATNQEGFIITVGQLEEINTTGSLQGETWADGDVLYLSPTTPGALTNIKPNGSTGHIVVMGYVEYAHANHGKIYVKIMNGWELDELHNVYINNPLNNQGLFYNASDQLWKNKSIASALGYTPVPDSRRLTINGTTYDLTADRTWSVGTVTSVTASSPLSSSGGTTPNITISQASGSTNGYLSSADWTTFNSKQPAGNYITSLSGEATGSGPGTAAVTLNNASVTAKVLTGVNITGGSISASDSILTAFGKLQNQINGLIGSSVYQGTWNASTNTPALASGVGTRGYYYIVNVAGSTNLDGITDWNVGDWAIFDGTAWQQVDNTDSVTSVNGQTGAVSLTSDNIPEGVSNLYFTQLRARQSITLTTSGSSGASTYDNSTGVLNIPQYQSVITNPVTGTGVANYVARWTSSSNISTGVLYDNGTNVGIGTASPAEKLDVVGNLRLQNSSLGATIYFGSGAGDYLGYYNSDSYYRTVGSHYFEGAGFYKGMWNSIGNLGIGTTAPQTKLTISGANVPYAGQLQISSNDYAQISFYNSGSLVPGASNRKASIIYNVSNSTFEIANQITSGHLILQGSDSGGGRVGIGTDNPSEKLSVNGNIALPKSGETFIFNDQSSSDSVSIGGASYVSFKTYSGGWFEKMRIANNGNVGIGTTNPYEKLDIDGNIRLGNFTTPGTRFIGYGNNTFANQFIAGMAIESTTVGGNYSQRLHFATHNYAVDAAVRMTITESGNVGIGTTNPKQKLDVNGIVAITNSSVTSYGELIFYENSAIKADIFVNGSSQNNYAGVNSMNIWQGSDAPIAFYTNQLERIRITSAGNVGIGTTAPSLKLQIQGSNITDSAIRIANTGAGGISWDIYSTNNGFDQGGGKLLFYRPSVDASSGTVVFDSSGNVGIGTVNPSFKTTISADITKSGDVNPGTAQLSLEGATTPGKRMLLGYDTNSNGFGFIKAGYYGVTWTPLSLQPDGGNVGVGTTQPSQKLHVDGNLRVTGAIFDSNNSAGTSGQVLSSTSSGTDWVSLSEITGVDGTGTANYVAKWQDANTIQNSLIYDNGTNVGLGTTNPKTKLDVNGTIGFGSKGMSISDVFADALTVNMNDHTGCYVKITAFGDWGNHSTIAYVAEFFLQASGGGYNEPGLIIRQVDNTANDDIQAQILDPVGTGTRNFVIQLKSTSSSYTPFNAYIQYEVRGLYNSVS
jgi:predicted heme/steroid binding protein